MTTMAIRREVLCASAALAAAILAGTWPAKAEAVEVGQKAPDFDLPATTGGNISLTQLRGKLVLIEFYGADFSPVCGENLSARKADFDKLQALGVQVLGISANHQFSQKAFADSLKLPYPLLSDETMVAAKSYKVVYGHTPGKTDYPHMKDKIAKRHFFLIDRGGIVRGKWLGEDMAVFPTEVLFQAAGNLTARR